MMRSPATFLAIFSSLAASGAALAQLVLPPAPPGVEVTTAFGTEFATVRNVNNVGMPWRTFQVQPYNSDIEFLGRGVVNYEYRIARTEITTRQWMEFVNVFSTQGFNAIPSDLASANFITGPNDWWGATRDPSFTGPGLNARRYMLRPDIPRAGDLPVSGISWREAALYCNWLHNDKPTTWNALRTGAYDTSTWNRPGSNGSFTDGDRLPGARVFMPTLNEWLKAAYYDPNRGGVGQEGWWEFANRSDVPLVPGLPGQGNTSAGLPALELPLASYLDQQSAYGLFDTSGGGSENLEAWGPLDTNLRIGRFRGGSPQNFLNSNPPSPDPLGVYSRFSSIGGDRPDSSQFGAIRLAMPVPGPHGFIVVALTSAIISRNRSRP